MAASLASGSTRTTLVLGLRFATLGMSLVLVTRLLGPTVYGAYMRVTSLAVVLGLILKAADFTGTLHFTIASFHNQTTEVNRAKVRSP